MKSTTYPRIIERLFLAIDPGRMHDALIVGVDRKLRDRLGLGSGHRICRDDIVYPSGEYCRCHLRRERQNVVELDAVEIGKPAIPVTWILFHHPDFVFYAPDSSKRTGAGIR